jgi:hypothetical protein
LSRISDHEREYIEQFIREYRAGYKVFAKATSQKDSETIAQAVVKMQTYELEKNVHQEAQTRPPLTFAQASLRVKKSWLGPKIQDIKQLILDDDMVRSGANEDIAAHAFKVWLDVARSRNLILDSEFPRKFKECMEKNKDLETQIHELQIDLKKCKDDFKAYRNRLQPLGKGRTERGGTEEAPPS